MLQSLAVGEKMNVILKRLVAFFLSVLVICLSEKNPVTAEEIEEPQQLYALSACLMDAESGRVLYEKEGDVHRANASTTKIMTLILTLERADLTDLVKVSKRAARQPDVQLNINEGETYRLKDLCYSLMLESHNDSAVAIAEHVAGSVEAFAALMNEKSDELGCTQTYFITPNGLDETDAIDFHGTSAKDLAKIMSYCILRSPKAEQFLEITQTPEYDFTDTTGKRHFVCHNHNAFLQMMEGVLSGKTGFTADAGYCYVGALQSNDRVYTLALLGCGWPNHKTYKWSDAKKLFHYGLEYYAYQEYEHPVKAVKIAVERGAAFSGNPFEQATVTLKEENHEPIRLLLRTDETILREEQISFDGVAPVELAEECGTVSYYIIKGDGTRQLAARFGLFSENEVQVKDVGFYLQFLIRRYFI